MQKDMKITNISRTLRKDQIVDKNIISFTHDKKIDYILSWIDLLEYC